MANRRHNWTPWSDEDSVKLFNLAEAGELTWPQISEQFTNRSPVACRQQYLSIKRAKGLAPPRLPVDHKPKPVISHTPEERQSLLQIKAPAPLPSPPSITAFILGDPLPGRSALDRKLSGVRA